MAKTTITFEIDKKLMEKFMKIVDDSAFRLLNDE
jgi:hypothetical protein